MNEAHPFSHVDAAGQPGMVDVSTKSTTLRQAKAEARVAFPPEVAAVLRGQAWETAKGPVRQTAVIAATQAVKRTADLIPFCHPLPIERCVIETFEEERALRITCEVAATYVTGVEMEAFTGATVAALTVIDMCKALSPALEISGVRLLEKTGGKREVRPHGA